MKLSFNIVEVGQAHTFATCSRWSGKREDISGHWTKLEWEKLVLKRDFLPFFFFFSFITFILRCSETFIVHFLKIDRCWWLTPISVGGISRSTLSETLVPPPLFLSLLLCYWWKCNGCTWVMQPAIRSFLQEIGHLTISHIAQQRNQGRLSNTTLSLCLLWKIDCKPSQWPFSLCCNVLGIIATTVPWCYDYDLVPAILILTKYLHGIHV